MSWQTILPVIYCFPSYFCSQFDLLERIFCTRYPFVSLFLWFKTNTFGRFGTFLAHIGVFFLNQLPTRFGITSFYSFCFFLRSLSFLLTFFWFKQWDFRHFWYISSALLEVCFWMTCQINLRLIYPYSLRFCVQFDLLEGKFWGRHPFLCLLSCFKKWHFGHFWHISSTYWRIFSEWVSKSF